MDIQRKGPKYKGVLVGDQNGWEYLPNYTLTDLKEWDWYISLSLSSKNDWRTMFVEGATEHHQGFNKALEEILDTFPELNDFWISYDGPLKPITTQTVDLSNITFYHGTSSTVLDRILEEGLKPRSETNVNPAYGVGKAGEGRPDAVYLTTQIGMANFAAKDAAKVMGGDPVVLTITGIDLSKAMADEDSGETDPVKSLETLGSIAYIGSIPPSKIHLKQVTASQKVRAYHGSDKPIRRFDPSVSTYGQLWFSEDKDKILRGESGAVSSDYLMTVELTVDKTAGWDEYDRLLLEQIQDQGYDSIKLDDDWILFDPDRVKVLEIESQQRIAVRLAMKILSTMSFDEKVEYLKHLSEDPWVWNEALGSVKIRWDAVKDPDNLDEAIEYINSMYEKAQKNLKGRDIEKELQEHLKEEKETLKYEGLGVEIDYTNPPPLSKLKGKKVWLYHGTSTALLSRILKEGLTPGNDASNYGTSHKDVYLTANNYGGPASATWYAEAAAKTHGGEDVVLRVLVNGSDLRPDDDDKDIKSGTYQYKINKVLPSQIKEVGEECNGISRT